MRFNSFFPHSQANELKPHQITLVTLEFRDPELQRLYIYHQQFSRPVGVVQMSIVLVITTACMPVLTDYETISGLRGRKLQLMMIPLAFSYSSLAAITIMGLFFRKRSSPILWKVFFLTNALFGGLTLLYRSLTPCTDVILDPAKVVRLIDKAHCNDFPHMVNLDSLVGIIVLGLVAHINLPLDWPTAAIGWLVPFIAHIIIFVSIIKEARNFQSSAMTIYFLILQLGTFLVHYNIQWQALLSFLVESNQSNDSLTHTRTNNNNSNALCGGGSRVNDRGVSSSSSGLFAVIDDDDDDMSTVSSVSVSTWNARAFAMARTAKAVEQDGLGGQPRPPEDAAFLEKVLLMSGESVTTTRDVNLSRQQDRQQQDRQQQQQEQQPQYQQQQLLQHQQEQLHQQPQLSTATAAAVAAAGAAAAVAAAAGADVSSTHLGLSHRGTQRAWTEVN